MPIVDVLYFVKKQHWALAVHFLMTFQKFIEILSAEVLQTLILKAQIEHFVPFMTCSKQLLDVMVEHIGLARPTHSNEYAAREIVYNQFTRLHNIAFHLLLVIAKDLFQYLLIHKLLV